MSATNKTAVYELPIFLGTDVPSWLTDWNGAMGIIDTAVAAAKAAADAAANTAGTAAADIITIQGNITSLQSTVGTHTTQIGTISGAINTINSLIGNGTPTTTDQTIIGAINELHEDQGDLADLVTSDKSSLVDAINELAQGGGGSEQSTTITSDGVKTYSQILDALFAAVDITKVTGNSYIQEVVAGGTVSSFYRVHQKSATQVGASFGGVYNGSPYVVEAILKASGSTLNNNSTENTNTVPTAGQTYTMYY